MISTNIIPFSLPSLHHQHTPKIAKKHQTVTQTCSTLITYKHKLVSWLRRLVSLRKL